EAGNLAKRDVPVAARQESPVLLQRQRPDPDPHAALRIPDLVADHRARAESRRGTFLLTEFAQIPVRQPEPRSLELAYLDGHLEIVLQQLLEGDRPAMLRRQEPGIERQG